MRRDSFQERVPELAVGGASSELMCLLSVAVKSGSELVSWRVRVRRSVSDACRAPEVRLASDFTALTPRLGRGFVGDLPVPLTAFGCSVISESVLECGSFAFRSPLTGAPDTVALLLSFCIGGASDIVSSGGRGLRACAMARGPRCRGKKGAATPARTILARTVVGKMFS